ncbi:hypothetical protein B0H13DRAFT_1933950 [Mycena leptocephala]|nr:hypothetical protein B0H13DRAFT_1933950 [Mycena leptocephala]
MSHVPQLADVDFRHVIPLLFFSFLHVLCCPLPISSSWLFYALSVNLFQPLWSLARFLAHLFSPNLESEWQMDFAFQPPAISQCRASQIGNPGTVNGPEFCEGPSFKEFGCVEFLQNGHFLGSGSVGHGRIPAGRKMESGSGFEDETDSMVRVRVILLFLLVGICVFACLLGGLGHPPAITPSVPERVLLSPLSSIQVVLGNKPHTRELNRNGFGPADIAAFGLPARQEFPCRPKGTYKDSNLKIG